MQHEEKMMKKIDSSGDSNTQPDIRNDSSLVDDTLPIASGSGSSCKVSSDKPARVLALDINDREAVKAAALQWIENRKNVTDCAS